LIEESLEVTNKWDSFGSISAQQSSKKIEIIDSYFSHAPSLNQNSVDSQADILESSSKREFEISHTEHEGKSCPRKCSGTEADITTALDAEFSGSASTDRTICARFEPHQP